MNDAEQQRGLNHYYLLKDRKLKVRNVGSSLCALC